MRRESIGFVFQSFNLVPVMSVADNVDYPLLLAGLTVGRAPPRASQKFWSASGSKRWRRADPMNCRADSVSAWRLRVRSSSVRGS